MLFLAWELRHPQPLLNVRKLGERAVGGASLAVMLVFLTAFGAMFFVAQQFQFVLGFGPPDTGVRLLPLAAAVSVGAAASARLTPRIGARAVVAGGMLVAAAGVLLLVRVDGASTYSTSSPLWRSWASVWAWRFHRDRRHHGELPDKDLGAAGGLNDTAIELGGSLGIAILGSVLASAYKDGNRGSLAALPVPNSPGRRQIWSPRGCRRRANRWAAQRSSPRNWRRTRSAPPRHSRSWTPRRSRSPTRSPGEPRRRPRPRGRRGGGRRDPAEPNRPGSGLSAQ